MSSLLINNPISKSYLLEPTRKTFHSEKLPRSLDPKILSHKPTISTYHLYDRSTSSCARRNRIALDLKHIPNVLVHDVSRDMRTTIGTKQYLAINPSGAVPTLIHEVTTPGHLTKQRFVLTQSIAILEYLDEMFPAVCPLLPAVGRVEERARVRQLVAVVTQDMFPFANRGNGKALREVAKATEEGRLEFIRGKLNEGFDAYEAMLEKCGGCLCLDVIDGR
jgi:maleylacetoacetate isomerase